MINEEAIKLADIFQKIGQPIALMLGSMSAAAWMIYLHKIKRQGYARASISHELVAKIIHDKTVMHVRVVVNNIGDTRITIKDDWSIGLDRILLPSNDSIKFCDYDNIVYIIGTDYGEFIVEPKESETKTYDVAVNSDVSLVSLRSSFVCSDYSHGIFSLPTRRRRQLPKWRLQTIHDINTG